MADITLEQINKLRTRTGLGMMDCKKALIAANGDIEKAVEELRKKGAAIAHSRADKSTSEGVVHAYIHPGSRMGVLAEINCETDFVARTEDMVQFARDLCLHIAALRPQYVSAEQVPAELLEKEREIYRAQLAPSGKPEKILAQIVEGKLSKLYSEICLLDQPFIKDDKRSVRDVLGDLMAKTGEKIQIRRFVRYELGA